MLDLARGFGARGYFVDLLYSTPPTHGMPEIPENVRPVALNAGGLLARVMRIAAYLRSDRPLAVFSFYDFANTVSLASRLSRVQTVVVAGIHNNVSDLFWSQRGVKSFFRRLLFPYLLRMADHIVAVSNGVADDLAELTRIPRNRIWVIYNPVPFETIRSAARQPVTHPFFDANSPVILAAGHLEPRKGFATLLRSFALVRERRPARLIILGEGSQRAELSRLAERLGIQEDLSMPGFAPNPFAYMARAALFVLSSEFEGFGLALVEALALGVPVVSTNCPSGPAEILDYGKYGRLVPVGNPEAMAGAILDALLQPRVPEAWGMDRFHPQRITDQYLSLLNGRADVPGGWTLAMRWRRNNRSKKARIQNEFWP